VGFPDGKVKAALLTKSILEVIKQDTIIKAQDYYNVLMRKQGIRAKIPLIIIKVLVSGS